MSQASSFRTSKASGAATCYLFETVCSWKLGTVVGSKLFVAICFVRLLHLVECFSNRRTRSPENPLTLRASEALEFGVLNPDQLAWHCNIIGRICAFLFLSTVARFPPNRKGGPNGSRPIVKSELRLIPPSRLQLFDTMNLTWRPVCLQSHSSTINRDLDEHGANSSIATAPYCSPWRIREASCDFPSATVPRLCLPCYPSCDNPCGLYRRLGSDRGPLEVWGRP
jgi:hypothetical protein